MKIETAKKLAWPWETEKDYVLRYGKWNLWNGTDWSEFQTGAEKESIPCPSIEEMLERMPKGTRCYKSFNDGYGAAWGDEKQYTPLFLEDTPSEALALLCLWLRDNNLMKWG